MSRRTLSRRQEEEASLLPEWDDDDDDTIDYQHEDDPTNDSRHCSGVKGGEEKADGTNSHSTAVNTLPAASLATTAVGTPRRPGERGTRGERTLATPETPLLLLNDPRRHTAQSGSSSSSFRRRRTQSGAAVGSEDSILLACALTQHEQQQQRYEASGAKEEEEDPEEENAYLLLAEDDEEGRRPFAAIGEGRPTRVLREEDDRDPPNASLPIAVSRLPPPTTPPSPGVAQRLVAVSQAVVAGGGNNSQPDKYMYASGLSQHTPLHEHISNQCEHERDDNNHQPHACPGISATQRFSTGSAITAPSQPVSCSGGGGGAGTQAFSEAFSQIIRKSAARGHVQQTQHLTTNTTTSAGRRPSSAASSRPSTVEGHALPQQAQNNRHGGSSQRLSARSPPHNGGGSHTVSLSPSNNKRSADAPPLVSAAPYVMNTAGAGSCSPALLRSDSTSSSSSSSFSISGNISASSRVKPTNEPPHCRRNDDEEDDDDDNTIVTEKRTEDLKLAGATAATATIQSLPIRRLLFSEPAPPDSSAAADRTGLDNIDNTTIEVWKEDADKTGSSMSCITGGRELDEEPDVPATTNHSNTEEGEPLYEASAVDSFSAAFQRAIAFLQKKKYQLAPLTATAACEDRGHDIVAADTLLTDDEERSQAAARHLQQWLLAVIMSVGGDRTRMAWRGDNSTTVAAGTGAATTCPIPLPQSVLLRQLLYVTPVPPSVPLWCPWRSLGDCPRTLLGWGLPPSLCRAYFSSSTQTQSRPSALPLPELHQWQRACLFEYLAALQARENAAWGVKGGTRNMGDLDGGDEWDGVTKAPLPLPASPDPSDVGHALLFTAPTGGGKTLVADYLILRAACRGYGFTYNIARQQTTNKKLKQQNNRRNISVNGPLSSTSSSSSSAHIVGSVPSPAIAGDTRFFFAEASTAGGKASAVGVSAVSSTCTGSDACATTVKERTDIEALLSETVAHVGDAAIVSTYQQHVQSRWCGQEKPSQNRRDVNQPQDPEDDDDGETTTTDGDHAHSREEGAINKTRRNNNLRSISKTETKEVVAATIVFEADVTAFTTAVANRAMHLLQSRQQQSPYNRQKRGSGSGSGGNIGSRRQRSENVCSSRFGGGVSPRKQHEHHHRHRDLDCCQDEGQWSSFWHLVHPNGNLSLRQQPQQGNLTSDEAAAVLDGAFSPCGPVATPSTGGGGGVAAAGPTTGVANGNQSINIASSTTGVRHQHSLWTRAVSHAPRRSMIIVPYVALATEKASRTTHVLARAGDIAASDAPVAPSSPSSYPRTMKRQQQLPLRAVKEEEDGSGRRDPPVTGRIDPSSMPAHFLCSITPAILKETAVFVTAVPTAVPTAAPPLPPPPVFSPSLSPPPPPEKPVPLPSPHSHDAWLPCRNEASVSEWAGFDCVLALLVRRWCAISGAIRRYRAAADANTLPSDAHRDDDSEHDPGCLHIPAPPPPSPLKHLVGRTAGAVASKDLPSAATIHQPASASWQAVLIVAAVDAIWTLFDQSLVPLLPLRYRRHDENDNNTRSRSAMHWPPSLRLPDVPPSPGEGALDLPSSRPVKQEDPPLSHLRPASESLLLSVASVIVPTIQLHAASSGSVRTAFAGNTLASAPDHVVALQNCAQAAQDAEEALYLRRQQAAANRRRRRREGNPRVEVADDDDHHFHHGGEDEDEEEDVSVSITPVNASGNSRRTATSAASSSPADQTNTQLSSTASATATAAPPLALFPPSDILICTAEKATILLQQLVAKGRCGELGCAFVDEVHMVGDGARGHHLETLVSLLVGLSAPVVNMTAPSNQPNSIGTSPGVSQCRGAGAGASSASVALRRPLPTLVPPSRTLLLLATSATLSNAPAVARWLRAATAFHTDYRPVPLHEHLVVQGHVLVRQGTGGAGADATTTAASASVGASLTLTSSVNNTTTTLLRMLQLPQTAQRTVSAAAQATTSVAKPSASAAAAVYAHIIPLSGYQAQHAAADRDLQALVIEAAGGGFQTLVFCPSRAGCESAAAIIGTGLLETLSHCLGALVRAVQGEQRGGGEGHQNPTHVPPQHPPSMPAATGASSAMASSDVLAMMPWCAAVLIAQRQQQALRHAHRLAVSSAIRTRRQQHEKRPRPPDDGDNDVIEDKDTAHVGSASGVLAAEEGRGPSSLSASSSEFLTRLAMLRDMLRGAAAAATTNKNENHDHIHDDDTVNNSPVIEEHPCLSPAQARRALSLLDRQRTLLQARRELLHAIVSSAPATTNAATTASATGDSRGPRPPLTNATSGTSNAHASVAIPAALLYPTTAPQPPPQSPQQPIPSLAPKTTPATRSGAALPPPSPTAPSSSVSVPLLLLGVAFHSAALGHDERALLEEAYRQGVVWALCCTTTLATGVNLPARRVIFRGVKIADQWMDCGRYRQAAGRAGRPGLDAVGESFILAKAGERAFVERVLLGQALPPLRSSFGPGARGMARMLLDGIVGGSVSGVADILRVVMGTLLAASAAEAQRAAAWAVEGRRRAALQNSTTITMADTSNDSAAPNGTLWGEGDDVYTAARAGLDFLEGHRFIEWSATSGRFTATPLGAATAATALEPDEALLLYQDLSRARRCISFDPATADEGDLQLLFLCVPYFHMPQQQQQQASTAATTSTSAAAGRDQQQGSAGAAAAGSVLPFEPNWADFYHRLYSALPLPVRSRVCEELLGLSEALLLQWAVVPPSAAAVRALGSNHRNNPSKTAPPPPPATTTSVQHRRTALGAAPAPSSIAATVSTTGAPASTAPTSSLPATMTVPNVQPPPQPSLATGSGGGNLVPPSSLPSLFVQVIQHKRLYAALILRDLIREVPLAVVAHTFSPRYANNNSGGSNSGGGMPLRLSHVDLRRLQEQASAFAATAAQFCSALRWWYFSPLFETMAARLSLGVEADLIPMMKIEGLAPHRARELARAGYRTPLAVASAAVEDIAAVLSASAVRMVSRRGGARRAAAIAAGEGSSDGGGGGGGGFAATTASFPSAPMTSHDALSATGTLGSLARFTGGVGTHNNSRHAQQVEGTGGEGGGPAAALLVTSGDALRAAMQQQQQQRQHSNSTAPIVSATKNSSALLSEPEAGRGLDDEDDEDDDPQRPNLERGLTTRLRVATSGVAAAPSAGVPPTAAADPPTALLVPEQRVTNVRALAERIVAAARSAVAAEAALLAEALGTSGPRKDGEAAKKDTPASSIAAPPLAAPQQGGGAALRGGGGMAADRSRHGGSKQHNHPSDEAAASPTASSDEDDGLSEGERKAPLRRRPLLAGRTAPVPASSAALLRAPRPVVTAIDVADPSQWAVFMAAMQSVLLQHASRSGPLCLLSLCLIPGGGGGTTAAGGSARGGGPSSSFSSLLKSGLSAMSPPVPFCPPLPLKAVGLSLWGVYTFVLHNIHHHHPLPCPPLSPPTNRIKQQQAEGGEESGGVEEGACCAQRHTPLLFRVCQLLEISCSSGHCPEAQTHHHSSHFTAHNTSRQRRPLTPLQRLRLLLCGLLFPCRGVALVCVDAKADMHLMRAAGLLPVWTHPIPLPQPLPLPAKQREEYGGDGHAKRESRRNTAAPSSISSSCTFSEMPLAWEPWELSAACHLQDIISEHRPPGRGGDNNTNTTDRSNDNVINSTFQALLDVLSFPSQEEKLHPRGDGCDSHVDDGDACWLYPRVFRCLIVDMTLADWLVNPRENATTTDCCASTNAGGSSASAAHSNSNSFRRAYKENPTSSLSSMLHSPLITSNASVAMPSSAIPQGGVEDTNGRGGAAKAVAAAMASSASMQAAAAIATQYRAQRRALIHALCQRHGPAPDAFDGLLLTDARKSARPTSPTRANSTPANTLLGRRAALLRRLLTRRLGASSTVRAGQQPMRGVPVDEEDTTDEMEMGEHSHDGGAAYTVLPAAHLSSLLRLADSINTRKAVDKDSPTKKEDDDVTRCSKAAAQTPLPPPPPPPWLLALFPPTGSGSSTCTSTSTHPVPDLNSMAPSKAIPEPKQRVKSTLSASVFAEAHASAVQTAWLGLHVMRKLHAVSDAFPLLTNNKNSNNKTTPFHGMLPIRRNVGDDDDGSDSGEETGDFSVVGPNPVHTYKYTSSSSHVTRRAAADDVEDGEWDHQPLASMVSSSSSSEDGGGYIPLSPSALFWGNLIQHYTASDFDLVTAPPPTAEAAAAALFTKAAHGRHVSRGEIAEGASIRVGVTAAAAIAAPAESPKFPSRCSKALPPSALLCSLLALEGPMVLSLLQMECTGIAFDPAPYQRLQRWMGRRAAAIAREAYATAGPPSNWQLSSPSDCAHVLFDRLGMPSIGNTFDAKFLPARVRTETLRQQQAKGRQRHGRETRSTKASVLAALTKLFPDCPLPALISEHRTMSTWPERYLQPLLLAATSTQPAVAKLDPRRDPMYGESIDAHDMFADDNDEHDDEALDAWHVREAARDLLDESMRLALQRPLLPSTSNTTPLSLEAKKHHVTSTDGKPLVAANRVNPWRQLRLLTALWHQQRADAAALQLRGDHGSSAHMDVDPPRIHGLFLQASTATGRLAMAEPNLQTIPHPITFPLALREGNGNDGEAHVMVHARLRAAFTATTQRAENKKKRDVVAAALTVAVSDDGRDNDPSCREHKEGQQQQASDAEDDPWVLLSADYCQIEARMLAHFSGDPLLLQIFNHRDDSHNPYHNEGEGVDDVDSTRGTSRKTGEDDGRRRNASTAEQPQGPLDVFERLALMMRRHGAVNHSHGHFGSAGASGVRLAADGSRHNRPHGQKRARSAESTDHALNDSFVPTATTVTTVTKEERKAAKTLCYGMIYGKGVNAIADDLELPSPEAAAGLLHQFRATYPVACAYIREVGERAARDGFVSTIVGRRRWLPHADSRNPRARAASERMAVNTLCQGSAADVMKVAMIRVHEALLFQPAGETQEQTDHPPSDSPPRNLHTRRLASSHPLPPQIAPQEKEEDNGEDGNDQRPIPPPPSSSRPVLCARPLLQIHDELLFEVRQSALFAVARLVRRCMTHTAPAECGLRVLLPVRLRAGPDWHHLIPIDD